MGNLGAVFAGFAGQPLRRTWVLGGPLSNRQMLKCRLSTVTPYLESCEIPAIVASISWYLDTYNVSEEAKRASRKRNRSSGARPRRVWQWTSGRADPDEVAALMAAMLAGPTQMARRTGSTCSQSSYGRRARDSGLLRFARNDEDLGLSIVSPAPSSRPSGAWSSSFFTGRPLLRSTRC
jgi:hypothetical protein